MRVLLLFAALPLLAQQPPAPAPPTASPAPAAATAQLGQGPQLDQVLKQVDDLMWHVKLDDIAEIDKVEYTSLPPARIPNPRRRARAIR